MAKAKGPLAMIVKENCITSGSLLNNSSVKSKVENKITLNA